MSKTVNIFAIKEISEPEQHALQACWYGEATPGQQRLALNIVIDKLSMADFLPYQVGSFDETAFLNGRIFVGKAMRRILKLETEG